MSGDRKDNVIHLAERSDSALHVDARQVLTEVLARIDAGEIDPDKLLVLFARDHNGGRVVEYSCAGLDMAERIDFLDAVLALFRSEYRHYEM